MAEHVRHARELGEYTNDEMCFSITMHDPKVNAPGWSWLAPAQASSCK